MNDPELIQKLKTGEASAYRYILEQYQMMVLNCAYKFVRDRALAEDLCQEVFLAVFESVNSFRADSKLSTWIYRITITKSLNVIKRQNRKKRFAMLTSLFGPERPEKKLPGPDNQQPDTEFENMEQREILNRALGKLPENQRVAFTLGKIHELKYEEIAQIMNTTLPAVESLLHRAKSNLRKILYTYYQNNL